MLELETEIKSKVQKSLCACLRRTGLSSLGNLLYQIYVRINSEKNYNFIGVTSFKNK